MTVKRKKFSLKELQDSFSSENKPKFEKSDSQWESFWNMPKDGSMTIRFLADVDDTNVYGMGIETNSHRLNVDGEFKNVQCLKDYGDECPICKASQEFYSENNATSGKALYRKKQHVMQALIVESDNEDDIGKIKYFAFNVSVWNIIKQDIMSMEDEDAPFFDEDEGRDFVLRKTEKAGYANYETSSFKRKPRALTDDEREAAKEAVELSSLRRERPTDEYVAELLAGALESL